MQVHQAHTFRKPQAYAALIVVAFLLLNSCRSADGSGDSGSIIFESIPQRPVVLDVKFIKNAGTDDEVTIEPNWFEWGWRIENNSDQRLYVITIKVEITTTSGSTEDSLDPNKAREEASYLHVLEPGETYDVSDSSCTTSSIEIPCATKYVLSGISAPEDNFTYSVRAEIVGFFEDVDDPSIRSRMSKSLTFTTQ